MQQEDPMCVGFVLRRQLPFPVARFALHKPMYQKYGLAISKYYGGNVFMLSLCVHVSSSPGFNFVFVNIKKLSPKFMWEVYETKVTVSAWTKI